MGDIRSKAAEIRRDHVAVLGMRTDLARQGKKFDGEVEVHARRISAFGQACALGLLAFAQLDIRPEAARAQRHLVLGAGIKAQLARPGIAFPRLGADLTGEFALWIVGAADEGAEAAKLEIEFAIGAGGAFARIHAVFAGWEDMGTEHAIKLVD